MRILLVPAALLALLADAPAASAQGAAQQERLDQGRRVAETWCANCHVIAPGHRGPAGDAAPPFQAIARMPSTTEMSLRAFLQTPHSRMPDYRLSQQELDGVVTWILALKDR
ncbi:c-type cytochrome [Paracraurococcus lichenis]|uniref:Cytochrome c n=1 Tax=Paracraurococcus lichenis TaxID=3064888 RepID=A0ABT9DTV8_9PROT|nr:cytochrome c [Paracraurococcus sp. LOR1-02]MDO9707336.1 cytochrome c [Paracraurococcus sp. LOR1-02]